MLAQPGADVMAEYKAVKPLGHDFALPHVSNVYNIKTEFDPYVVVSDVRARVAQCSP